MEGQKRRAFGQTFFSPVVDDRSVGRQRVARGRSLLVDEAGRGRSREMVVVQVQERWGHMDVRYRLDMWENNGR